MPIARADRAVLAALCACAALGQAAELGTLFHTAEERARLDRLRRGDAVQPAATASAPARAGALTGFVKRSDGRGTAWIDGVPVPVSPRAAPWLDPKAVRGYSAADDDRVKIERRPGR